MSRLSGIVAVALLSSACATTLTTHQLAKPVEPGHFEANLATGLYVPLGATLGAIAEGEQQVQALIEASAQGQPYAISDEERERLISAGLALAILPPSPSQELAIRTGILRNWDAGLRYSFNALRLDTKYRVYHTDDGPDVEDHVRGSFDVAIGLAGSKYLFSNFVFDALELVRLDDFSRWDVEVPVYVSRQWGEIFALYAAPKYIFSKTEFDPNLVNAGDQFSNITGLEVPIGQTDATMHFVGASVGLMIGFKYAFLMLELTGGQTWASSIILGRRRELGGFTLHPSAGLQLRY